MPNATEQILEELKEIKADLAYIKQRMPGALTENDRQSIREAREDLQKGRTKRLI